MYAAIARASSLKKTRNSSIALMLNMAGLNMVCRSGWIHRHVTHISPNRAETDDFDSSQNESLPQVLQILSSGDRRGNYCRILSFARRRVGVKGKE